MDIRTIRFLAALACALPVLGISQSAAKKPPASRFRVKETTDPAGWKIMDGENMVAGYIADSDGRPIVYPVIGPSGQFMTRHFPMTASMPFEERDHPHHRSVWFAHGDVNGIDFWSDGDGTGTIVQRISSAMVEESSFLKSDTAIVMTENDWLSPEGERVLSDVRRTAFFVDDGRRIIDFDILLIASDTDVNFGDTKEGTFGVRVAGSMKVEANQGGQIVNADGDKNADAWGKRSPWVDYSGPVYVEGKPSQVAGITIHNCPSSFGYPVRWHVRDYGLFAANPFGVHDFEGGSKRGGIVLSQGKTLRLNYRVILHDGGFDAKMAEADSEKFANDARPALNSAQSAE